MNLQLGYGRNFIGDGYRSLITTDGVSPYPFFKINTTFLENQVHEHLYVPQGRPSKLPPRPTERTPPNTWPTTI